MVTTNSIRHEKVKQPNEMRRVLATSPGAHLRTWKNLKWSRSCHATNNDFDATNAGRLFFFFWFVRSFCFLFFVFCLFVCLFVDDDNVVGVGV